MKSSTINVSGTTNRGMPIVMQRVANLIHEIDQVLTRPDDDSLKTLEGFLQNESISKDEISVWCFAKPCHIVPLAGVVIECPAALQVLKTLISSSEFVNAVLEGDPSLFATLVNKLASSTTGEDAPGSVFNYPTLTSCFTLKHESLAGQTGFLVERAVASAIDSTNETNLRRLSELCGAVSSNILDFFREDLLVELSCCLRDLCSHPLGTNSHIEMMLAQSLMAQLTIAFQKPQTPSKSSLETPPRSRFPEACQKRIFKCFSDSNALTTLNITVLRLAMFCSKERQPSPSVALEALKIARKIMEPISSSVRKRWAVVNAKLFDKFLARLNREAHDLEVRLEGIIFCVSLIDMDTEKQPFLVKVASKVLLDLCGDESIGSATATGNDKAVADVLTCLCLCEDENTAKTTTPDVLGNVLARLMSFIVEQCQPLHKKVVNTVVKMHRARNILNSLHIAQSEYDISGFLVDFIHQGSLPDWWDSDATFSLSPSNGEVVNCKGEEVCSKSLDRLRSEVAVNFSALLLTAAWHSSKSLRNPETCQTLLSRLKGPSWGDTSLNCSYGAYIIMGLGDAGALTEAQADCGELRARLEDEQRQRSSIEGRLAQSEKLLKEERQASTALQQYLAVAERDGFEKGKALEAAKEDYQELLQEADRRVGVLESDFIREKLMFKADCYGREKELEDEMDEMRASLERKDEEVRLERQNRAILATELEVALGQSKEQIEKLRLRVTEKDKALGEADTLRAKLMELLEGRHD